MLNLIKNELYKIFANKRIYIFMVILSALIIIPCAADLILDSESINFDIGGQMFPFSILRMVIDAMLPMFIIVLISDIYTEEYSSGTLKLQMIHPISRGKLLLSKVISLAITLLILLMFSMLIGYIIGTAFFGWGDVFKVNDVVYSTGGGILLTLASYLISVLPMIIFGMFILLIGMQFNSGGAAVGTSIGIFLLMSYLSQLIESARPYMISNYFDLYSFFIKNFGDKDFLSYIIAFTIYGIGSYIICHYSFQKKDILY